MVDSPSDFCALVLRGSGCTTSYVRLNPAAPLCVYVPVAGGVEQAGPRCSTLGHQRSVLSHGSEFKAFVKLHCEGNNSGALFGHEATICAI